MIRNLNELGPILRKIMTRLMANQNLMKYLYYTDKDPLNHNDLTQGQIKNEIYEELIKVVPRLVERDDARSVVALKLNNGILNGDNTEFRDINLSIYIFVPMTQWIIKSENLRPFDIMGEIQKSIAGKYIDGIGKLKFVDFTLANLSDEMSCYEMTFQCSIYD